MMRKRPVGAVVFLLLAFLFYGCAGDNGEEVAEVPELPAATAIPATDTPSKPTDLPPTETPVPPPPTETPLPPTETAVPATATPPLMYGIYEINGHNMYISCKGSGAPTVILDNHYYGFDPMEFWAGIRDSLASQTRTCVYRWSGYDVFSWENPSDVRRTLQTTVDELQALLTAAGVEGPYVLVGHGLGGLTSRLYASQHMEEIAGVVLLDSYHKDQQTRFEAVLGQPLYAYANPGWAISQFVPGIQQPEIFEEAQTMDDLGKLPLVVISEEAWDAGPLALMLQGKGVDEETMAQLQDAWLQMQQELLALSTNSEHIVWTDTAKGNLFIDKPEELVAIVDRLVEAAHGE